MRLSMLQFRSTLGSIDENFDRAARLIARAAVEKPDVIVLPELWTTGYYPTPIENYADGDGRRTQKFLSDSARSNRVNIVGGTAIVGDGDQFFNRNYNFDRDGALVGVYDKAHLFSMAGEEKIFGAGDRIVTYELDGVKCSTIVCYDLRFPELSRRLALEGVTLMFVPAAWPLRRLEHWQILNRARAIENQMFVCAVNSAGHSMALDPWGEVLLEGGAEELVLTTEIDLERIKKIRSAMNVFADRNPIDEPVVI